MSRVVIVAGPNGAGKTTFAREYLPQEGEILQFVNADLIAAGISPFDVESAAVIAGRIMLRRIDELASEGADFALETTLSGRWLIGHIHEWRKKGYTIELYYLRLSSPEMAIERVAKRVREGGHNIDEAVIRRRFARSLDLLEQKFKPIVDSWMVYDNSGSVPTVIDGKTNF